MGFVREEWEEGEIVEEPVLVEVEKSVSIKVEKLEPVSRHELEETSSSIASSRSPTPTLPSALTPPHAQTHVRFMTHTELDRAKSLVLDLLGWGVTPEYLIEYGVSKQVIFKIFTDLNLRLPVNLGPVAHQ